MISFIMGITTIDKAANSLKMKIYLTTLGRAAALGILILSFHGNYIYEVSEIFNSDGGKTKYNLIPANSGMHLAIPQQVVIVTPQTG